MTELFGVNSVARGEPINCINMHTMHNGPAAGIMRAMISTRIGALSLERIAECGPRLCVRVRVNSTATGMDKRSTIHLRFAFGSETHKRSGVPTVFRRCPSPPEVLCLCLPNINYGCKHVELKMFVDVWGLGQRTRFRANNITYDKKNRAVLHCKFESQCINH